jgi:4-amino-4-deoxy-L-arabinose transferase-like glycosyltransferase
VLSLVAFHAVNNWIYVRTQVTILGWDRPAHLVRTLVYNDMLQRLNIQSLFEAMTWSWNRPPLSHLMAVPLYRAFGVSTDVALMGNVIFIAVLLFSVYGIGRKLYGWQVGVLAAFFTSTYPILFSISRMPYVEYAVTALVAVAIYLLVASEGFRRRGFSLLLGLAIGLGILTKWPFIAFTGGPIAYVALSSGALGDVKAAVITRGFGSSLWRRIWVSPAFHLAAGLGLTLLWYWPNRARLGDFALGYGLIPISWLLVSYALSRPAGQGANLLSAVLVGGCIGSIWSLPNLRFSERFITVVYSGLNMEGSGLGPANPSFYLRYLSYLPYEQLSPLYFVLLLVALAVLVYAWWRHGVKRFPRSLSEGSWILALWFGVSILIFTFSLTMNSRFDVALLPALSLVTAHGLLSIGSGVARRTLVAAAVVAGLVQFSALSFDGLGWLRERAVLTVPAAGQVKLLGQGSYIELPSSDRTDSRYFVGPLVLDFIAGEMVRDGSDTVQLGNLVNRSYSNNAILQYLMYDAYPGIELREFARSEWEQPPYYERLFECDYLLMKTDPFPGLREYAQEAMTIVQTSPSLFEEVFQVVWEHALPDGDTVYLYKKRYHLTGDYNAEDFRSAAGEIAARSAEGDGMVLVPSQQAEVLGRYYHGQLPAYGVPREASVDAEFAHELLSAVAMEDQRVFLVLFDEEQFDPDRYLEGWLEGHGRRVWDWSSADLRVVLYDLSLFSG